MRGIGPLLLGLAATAAFLGTLAVAASGQSPGEARSGGDPGRQESASVLGREAAPAVPGELIVEFKEGVPPALQAAVAPTNGVGVKRQLLSGRHALVSVPAGYEEEFAQRLLGDPTVAWVERNLVVRAAFAPNDEFYPLQWNLPMIQMEQAWEISQGAGVTVAVVDTGAAYEDYTDPKTQTVYARAPDLAGVTFVSPKDFVNDDNHANDDNGHGTHIVGTIAQTTDNGTGAAGVAYRASIMPIKVLNSAGQGSSVDVADGVYWAVDHGADIVNLSLESAGITKLERQAYQHAEAQGVLVLAAAGNGHGDRVGDPYLAYPAALASVIAVGAVGPDAIRSSFSNYGLGEGGKIMELVAPGGDIDVPPASGVLQNTYLHFCNPSQPVDFTEFVYCAVPGTSMATAHVTGVAALVESAFPSLTRAEVREVLTCTAKDLGSEGLDVQYGSGLVQALNSLRDIDRDGKPDALQDSDGDGTLDCHEIIPPNGCSAVAATPTPTPTATPTPEPSPTPTDTPTPTPSPTPAPRLCGDVDCNGAVDTMDVLFALRFSAALEPYAACVTVGNVDCDGDVDAVDALMILRYAASLPVNVPLECRPIGT